MSIKKQYLHGGSWLLSEKFISFIIQFAGGIALARLLEPEDFGAVAMASGIFLVIGRLCGIGIGPELMRLEERDESFNSWLSTFFWLNGTVVLLSFCIALSVAYLSPLLSTPARQVFWVIALGWTINNFFNPARSLLQKHKRFKAMSILEMLPKFVGTPVAVLMAWSGAGIWALVIPQAVVLAFTSQLAMALERFSLRFSFSKDAFRHIKKRAIWYVSFGFAEEGYQRGDDLILGSFLGDATLGFYRRAYNLGGLLHNQVGVVLNKLGFPYYADKKVHENTRFRILQVNIKVILYGLFSIIVILAWYIDTIVVFLYGEKWLESAGYFVHLTPYAVLWPLYHQLKGYVVAQGGIRTASIIDILKLITMLAGSLAFVDQFGVIGVAWSVNTSILLGVVFIGTAAYKGRFDKLGFMVRPLIFIMLTLFGLIFLKSLFLYIFLALTVLFIYLERNELQILIKKQVI